ncbi:AI-2E family transporter [Nonomuraea soli]|uniref:Putative PurR-regulated permease PerM n=1 Tax=Nonomuraea soli TaxID=1032476 RepID=A0A7W0CLG9_9ACTN|nr:AI-2E family transporter [Nonomuraea soli]MBA2893310.1 putative PurR-regulated permease PerM [Nonomuraea soli]
MATATRAWRALGVIALIVVIALFLWYLRTVVIPIILGMFLTTLFLPPARWLRSRGMGRGLSTTLVCLGGVVLGGAFIALLVQPTVDGFAQLKESVGQAVDQLHELAISLGLDDQTLNNLLQQTRAYIDERASELATSALTGAKVVGEVVIGAVLALILAIYFTHGGDRLFAWLVELLPIKARPRVRDGGALVFDVIGRYIRGVALVGLVDGFFIGLALWILKVPIALPLAVLTFIGAFLPIVGAFVAGLLAAAVAFAAHGWVVALIVVGVTIAVQQIEGHVLAPQIYGRALDLPGAVILIAIAVGSVLAGITGAFLAAPIASAAVALVRNRELKGGLAAV